MNLSLGVSCHHLLAVASFYSVNCDHLMKIAVMIITFGCLSVGEIFQTNSRVTCVELLFIFDTCRLLSTINLIRLPNTCT